MYVRFLGVKGNWREVANSANTTINKEESNREISSSWKRRMLLCEHSPIRQIIVKWRWYDLPRWVSDHFVRHKFGIEHWVKSDRTDRTGIDRNELSQGSLTMHESEANSQALINMSRKRLCKLASKETRDAMELVIEEVSFSEPELSQVCVPDCIYRGHCYEFKSCGYHKTLAYRDRLSRYRNNINIVEVVE